MLTRTLVHSWQKKLLLRQVTMPVTAHLTATVLAQAIVAEGSKNVTAGASPMDIKRGIVKGRCAKVVESIKDQA